MGVNGYYIYSLSGEELDGSRMTETQLKDELGSASRDYIIAQIGRAKGWANLIAQNWLRALAMKREQHEDHILDYETQEFCHEGAVNNVIRWQRRLEAFDRRQKTKVDAKRGRTETI